MTSHKYRLLFLALLIFSLFACKSPPPQITITQNPNGTAAAASLTPQDFSLDTVVSLLKSGVSDGPTLEQKINDPSTGINNIDVDQDGKTDYVNVVEAQIPSGKKMEFVAHPSGGGPDVSFAALKFAQADTGVDVQAGYGPAYDPQGTYYYHDTLLANMLFAQWLFMPSRPYYYSSVPMGYTYRTRMAPTTFTQTRTTYTTQTRISPVVSQPRPSTFNAARLTAAPRSPATTMGGAAQGVSNFQTDTRTKSAGTGFGSSPAPRTVTPTSAPASRPASSPSFSRPSSSVSSGRKR
jgi:hypothetical protein